MKIILRDSESGVSEVIGTILILAMTVVLFATIIIWVTNIPTPSASARLEVDGLLTPLYDLGGNEIAGNISLRHLGGESLPGASTAIYVTVEQGGTFTTEILDTRGVVQPPAINAGEPYGLMDGPDLTWNAGERWVLTNYTIRPSTNDVTVTIVDTVRSIILWEQRLSPPAGTRPPIFLEKWADNIPSTAIIDPVETGQEFWIFARVTDPDKDLDPASVYGTLTIFYGTADSCASPQRMYDDGTRGDLVPSDGIFTLSRKCMKSPSLDWDGSIVLFNATDQAGHRTATRMTLSVVPGPDLGTGQNGTGGTGRPQNLRWNGRQGYNIFNATQWDKFRYSAKETRTFRGTEEVVVVVGSLDLENTFLIDQFLMWDPYSGYPPSAVVYGSDKSVTQTSEASSSQAFSFLEFINGYYIFTYRYHMNDPATVGTNFYRTPVHPPDYYFSRYSVDVLLQSSSGIRFNTTDSINITDEDGFYYTFPQVTTYSDAAFTQNTQTFDSTAVVYVEMSMFSVDPTIDPNVQFGNIIIKDYQGGTELWRAPAGGNNVNSPICNVNGNCASGDAITRNAILRTYRFAINLSRADQDPWVEGPQNYALTLSSVRDTDEIYALVSTQLVIRAPLYKLDILIGSDDTSQNAWGTHDYGYYYENVNGLDRWRQERLEFCSGANCALRLQSVAFLDFDQDGDLDSTGSWIRDVQNSEIVLYRRDLDFTGNVIFTRFLLEIPPTGVFCLDLETGDVTGDGAPEIVCGASNGHVWYYKNDGSYSTGKATKVNVDLTRLQAVLSVAVGDFNGDGAQDIAVGGASGRLTWYPNLDGLGRFQNTGIVDDWFANAERTIRGTRLSGSFLNTFVADDSYEVLREGVVTEPVRNGATENSAFDTGTVSWSYADWVEPGAAAAGAWANAGGNPGGYASLTTNFVASQVVAGYWYQAFVVTGSPPFAAALSLDWQVTTFGATGGRVELYAFVDPAAGAPVLGQEVWSSGPLFGPTAWANVSNLDVSGRIVASGTYYLKVAMRTQNAAAGATSTGGFDNVGVTWSSTGGDASELEHYWRLTLLPIRPGTTFSFNLEARHNVNGEGDNFVFAYSMNVILDNPLTGTYTTMVWVNATADQTYSFILPATVAGKVLWIRVLDMDRTVGNTNLDGIFVDQMYVRADTPSGATGSSLTNPGDATGVMSIDADDQNGDGYADLAVGTAGGRVFKYLGSPGGLQTPGGALVGPLGAEVVGVRFGAISDSQAGLEVAVAFGRIVRVYTAFGATGTPIPGAEVRTTETGASGNVITAFGVGDVNGDGFDDIVVGTDSPGMTKSGELLLWINRNNGLSWSPVIRVNVVGAKVWSIALGDASKAQYLGR